MMQFVSKDEGRASEKCRCGETACVSGQAMAGHVVVERIRSLKGRSVWEISQCFEVLSSFFWWIVLWNEVTQCLRVIWIPPSFLFAFCGVVNGPVVCSGGWASQSTRFLPQKSTVNIQNGDTPQSQMQGDICSVPMDHKIVWKYANYMSSIGCLIEYFSVCVTNYQYVCSTPSTCVYPVSPTGAWCLKSSFY